MTKATITLAMMAHNEARYLPIVQQNLGDRINSVIIISDPPNNDDTMVVAKQVFGHYSQCELIERPWPTDKYASSTARNEILNNARLMGDDYVLWLDPDSPLVGTIPDELDAPIYAFNTVDKSTQISWFQPHLLRSDTTFQWHGRIHEFLDTGQTPVAVLTTAFIDRDGSGGGIERMRTLDLQILKEEVRDEPNNPRHPYYLAQTYRDIGEVDQAILWYKRRAAMYGFDQETYYSMYMVGALLMVQSKLEEAEKWLLRAYTFRPSRTEALERLTEIYQSQNEAVLAIQLMRNALATPPSQDVLLVHNRKMV